MVGNMWQSRGAHLIVSEKQKKKELEARDKIHPLEVHPQ
jgi:hypothetical protein